MPEQTVATPANSVPRDAHTIAGNIIKGITDKASGKPPVADKPAVNGQPAPETAADPNAGKEKYVVEGKEVWLTPQERTAWIQKGMAFQPRMDQLARLAQEQQQLMRGLITNPGAVLANVAKQNNVPLKDLVQRVLHGNAGDDVKEAVGKWYYENAVEPLQMTPEQLKAREDAKWRQQREIEDKQSQENMIRADNQKKFLAAMGHIKAQIAEAMKDSGLPDNNTPLGTEMAWLTAKVMQLADKRRQPMTPKQAIEIVKQHRIRSVQTAYYETLADKDEDGELISKELGDKIVAKVKKFLLKQAKGGAPNPPVVGAGKPSGRSGERKTINSDDFHDYLEELKKKG